MDPDLEWVLIRFQRIVLMPIAVERIAGCDLLVRGGMRVNENSLTGTADHAEDASLTLTGITASIISPASPTEGRDAGEITLLTGSEARGRSYHSDLDLEVAWGPFAYHVLDEDAEVRINFTAEVHGHPEIQQLGDPIVVDLTKPFWSRERRSAARNSDGDLLYLLYWQAQADWRPECTPEEEEEELTASRRVETTFVAQRCPDANHVPECWRTTVYNKVEHDLGVAAFFNWAPDFVGLMVSEREDSTARIWNEANLKSRRCRPPTAIETIVLHEVGWTSLSLDDISRRFRGLYHFLVLSDGTVTQQIDAATMILHADGVFRQSIGIEIVNGTPQGTIRGWSGQHALIPADDVGLGSVARNRDDRDVIPLWYRPSNAYVVPTPGALEAAYELVMALLDHFSIDPSWPLYPHDGESALLWGPSCHADRWPQRASVLSHAPISSHRPTCGDFPLLYTYVRHHGRSPREAYEEAIAHALARTELDRRQNQTYVRVS